MRTTTKRTLAQRRAQTAAARAAKAAKLAKSKAAQGALGAAKPTKVPLPRTVEELAATGAPADLVWKHLGITDPTEDQKRDYDRGEVTYRLHLHGLAVREAPKKSTVLIELARKLPGWKTSALPGEDPELIRARLRSILERCQSPVRCSECGVSVQPES